MLRKLSRLPRTSLSQRLLATFETVKGSNEAVAEIPAGASCICGGFGLAGIPENMIQAIQRKKTKNLTVISNTAGVGDWGLGLLLQDHLIQRVKASFMGANPPFEKQYLNGEVEVDLTPQGTLAEKIRSGGGGIAAFFTRTGASTYVEEGKIPLKFEKGKSEAAATTVAKERRIFKGEAYIMEETLHADYALLKAKYADKEGNLYYYKTANNFNQDAAGNGRRVIAEVEKIVDAGEMPPEAIHTPGLFVDKIYIGEKWERRIEKRIYSQKSTDKKPPTPGDQIRLKIAKRAAQELQDGMYVNLGIGIPTLIPFFVPKEYQIMIHSELGVIGVGPFPEPGQEHAEIINAGKETITLLPGASTFNSSTSFGIIRGNHLDITVLGSLQVSRDGDIANWIIPGKKVTGMGGAMDLVSCNSKVIVTMLHNERGGGKKILDECTLPLTGKNLVDMIITEKAVFVRREEEFVLTEVAEGYTVEDIKKCTGYDFKVEEPVAVF